MAYKSSLGQADHEKRSKLAHVKGTGSSHSGSKHWVAGKVSSILGIPLVIYIIGSMFIIDIKSMKAVHTWISNPINGVLMIVGFALFAWHLMLAAEEAVHDYIDSHLLEVSSLLFLRLFTIISIVFVALNVVIISLK